jgi:L-ribulokinase
MGTSTCDITTAAYDVIGEHTVRGICGQVDGSVLPGRVGFEAGQAAFGDIYAWYKRLLGWSLKFVADMPDLEDKILGELTRQAEQIPLTADDMIAVDWFNGRRSPDDDPLATGQLMNLTLATSAPEIVKALVEATAFGSRAINERLADEGLRIDTILAVGGISKKSRFVMQTMADVIGVPIRVVRSTQACALGSAMNAAVAAGVYPYALGSDTGDSIRKPAAYCGIVGYKPTYGMISRYGLYPFASSLDHCGALTRSVKDAAIVVDAMKGIDPNDMTSWDSSKMDLLGACKEDVKGKKVCYVKEICNIDNYPEADDELKAHLENFHKTLDLLKGLGVEVEEVSVDRKLLNAVYSVYRVIHSAEATSNMSNLTGIIFGPRGEGDNYIEMMKDHRTKGFSPLIKRRFIIGSYVLQKENKDRYFNNAQRVRRLPSRS